MKQLAEVMVHPGEVSNSPMLCENDQLNNSARLVMDNLEAVFCTGDIKGMKKTADSIPNDTAASALLRQ